MANLRWTEVWHRAVAAREFLGGPVFRTPRFHCQGRGFNLVRELRSCKSACKANNKQKRGSSRLRTAGTRYAGGTQGSADSKAPAGERKCQQATGSQGRKAGPGWWEEGGPALGPAGSPPGSAQGFRSLQTQVLVRRLGPNVAPLG